MTETAQRTDSYEEFVTARSGALYRRAYLLCGNHSDAEDLLQTTLIKLYAAWRRASAADSVEAYARRIMVNALVSSRRAVRFTRERLVEAPPEVASRDADPHDRLSIWPHVAGLPPRQRAVVVLRFYEGLSGREIAEALDCSVGTVKSTASAALRNLRTRMGESS